MRPGGCRQGRLGPSAVAMTALGAASHLLAEAERCYRPLLGRLSSEPRGRSPRSQQPPPISSATTCDSGCKRVSQQTPAASSPCVGVCVCVCVCVCAHTGSRAPPHRNNVMWAAASPSLHTTVWSTLPFALPFCSTLSRWGQTDRPWTFTGLYASPRRARTAAHPCIL
jgi:hypothetical protein